MTSAAEPTVLQTVARPFRRMHARLSRHTLYRVLVSAIVIFGQRRAFGLSAEAAFWAAFSLPWLVLGLVSATSGLAGYLGEDVTDQVIDSIVEAASKVLTQQSIDDFLIPLLNSVLQGSTSLTIVGFVVALWSGSRIFATFVEGALIINGRDQRGFVHTRGLALGIYALGLIVISVLVFTVVRWPGVWATVLGIAPGPNEIWWALLILVGMVASMTTILYLADPNRGKWRVEAPGGTLSVMVWLVASWGLSFYLQWLSDAGSIYGAIGAPIAVLLWIFISMLSVFVGMTLNAAIRMARADQYLTPEDPGPPFPAAVPPSDDPATSDDPPRRNG